MRPTLGQGGADRVTVTLLAAIDRRRFRPTLILMRGTGPLLDELPGDVPVHDLSSGSLWTAWMPLTAALRRLSPDVLFSTSSGTNLIAVIARQLSRRRMRLVLSERNVLLREPRSLKRLLQLRLKRYIYPMADCVTAVSRGVADDLIERLHLPASKLRVVYNPAVPPEISSLAAAASPHPWFEEELPVVLGVGRLVPAKGFDLLLEAFARLRRPARLMLLGEGPERGPLERLSRALGIEARVHFAGFDLNPFRYMSRCQVFVLSSRFEGLPGALIQAMACGAAAVAADCHAGPAEILEDGVSGLLVPANDGPALTSGIDLLLGDAQLRSRLGRAARSAAVRFSVPATLDGYVAALAGNGAARDA